MKYFNRDKIFRYNTSYVFVTVLFIGLLLGLSLLKVFTVKTAFEKEADAIIQDCSKKAYHPACYDTEIPKVMDRGFSYEDAFKITTLIQKKDNSYWYCHVLGHNLSAKETAKDVTKWTEVVARAPRGMCSNGALHGAFQERFRGAYVSTADLKKLIPEIRTICEIKSGIRDFTGMEQASCYHALGHLTMYITNGDVKRSIKLCDKVAKNKKEDFSQLCYDGAYMQIFQPLEPEDVALVQKIEPKTQKDSIIFCNRFSGIKRASCISESWPLFVKDFDANPKNIKQFCNRESSAKQQARCLNAVFYVMSARTLLDPVRVNTFCKKIDKDIRAQCYANSASRFLETDYNLAEKAIQVCAFAKREGYTRSCYQELLFYSAYNYTPGSDALVNFCKKLPDEWSYKCLNGQGSKIKAPFY